MATKKVSKSSAPDELQQAMGVLEKAGLRQTQPRLAILRALVAEHGPFSADEMLALPALKGLDRVTVYRCLTAFEEVGLVRRCEFGDAVSRYEFSGGDHHHHHVICKRCRKVESLEDCVPKSLIAAVREMGYEDVSHSLEFFGVCRDCRRG